MQLFKRLFGRRNARNGEINASRHDEGTEQLKKEMKMEEYKSSSARPERLAERFLELDRLLPASLWTRQAGMIETIQETVKEGKRLVSNREFDEELSRIRNGNGITCFRTGTLVIFEEGGRDFRDKVEYSGGVFGSESIVFQVPEKYRGRSGCIVAIHPYFSIRGNGSGLNHVEADDEHLHLLSRFAVRNGLFSREGVFGLPVNDRDGKEKISHHMKQCAFIGLGVRSTKNPDTIYTSELPDAFDPSFKQIGALVKPIVTVENYIELIVAAIKNGGAGRLNTLVVDWMAEDRMLRKGLDEAGIRL